MSKATLCQWRRWGLPCEAKDNPMAPNRYDLVAVLRWLNTTGLGPAARRRRMRAAFFKLWNEHADQITAFEAAERNEGAQN